MFDSIRLWYLRRVSEPFLAFIRARFKVGPIAAVAIAELVAVVGQMAAIAVGIVTFRRLEILPDFVNRAGTLHAIIFAVMAIYLFVIPAVIAGDLMAVSRGEKTTLSPWTVGFARSQGRNWRLLPYDLALFALFVPYLVLFVVLGAWTGVPLAIVIPGFFFLESLKGAVWQNHSARGLLAASAPPDPY